MRSPPALHSMGRMPMQRGPMMNSASGFRHPFFNDRREDRFEARHPFFNDRREDRLEARRFNRFNHFHPFNHFNNVVFIGDFGFPGWWGWGPWWGWGYPYGYYGGYNYGYGYYGGYGSDYGYGGSSGSRVAELQRRLARAGYYHGAIDGIMGPATRRAIRAYERHGGYGG
jgi:hypothetical protein